MPDALLIGLALVLAGGMAQGAFMAPMKWVRGWAWENSWLVFATTAYLFAPWLLAWLTIPHLLAIYAGTSATALISVFIFGAAWGIGAVTFGLGVAALGMALGFAIILGVATVVGTLIPMVFSSSDHASSQQLIFTCLCLTMMLAGVGLCSLAGKWKERDAAKSTSYRRGVIVCVTSGVLSACGNLGLSFAGSITQRALALGVSEATAPNAVWTLLTVPLFICNAAFALFRMKRHHTGTNFRASKSLWNFVSAIIMGVLWMGGLSLYGSGTRKLGPMGVSLGFAIFMSSTVLMASVIGVLTGEWRDAPENARGKLKSGIVLLVLSICCLAALNRSN